uniref:Uncharacterized protein n=1 Tax=Chromera velia CCMP2878 TaxID=1169474 RepID=A0A0G4I243_9ALVE|eukprot:Cvel_10305.t1-p1 / transcript=Cvel_10305.t1 / gene=Cvel_10305 / organism=Chromera_velia_CCMP2878 / gene_product=hypothetical protein / transcript_product=hypothetical protein / location=Cvel_scaffold618:58249-63484(-) / protein_length=866 / sequence_SO=supercontig / SO=protein_coding / is_pseudo=false
MEGDKRQPVQAAFAGWKAKALQQSDFVATGGDDDEIERSMSDVESRRTRGSRRSTRNGGDDRELTQRLHALAEQNEVLQDAEQKAYEQIEKLKLLLKEKEDAIATLNDELKATHNEAERNASLRDEARQQYEHLQKELQDAKNMAMEDTAAGRRPSTLESARDESIKDSLARLALEVREAQAQVTELQHQNGEFKQQLSETAAERGRLQTEHRLKEEEMKKEIENTKSSETASHARISELSQLLDIEKKARLAAEEELEEVTMHAGSARGGGSGSVNVGEVTGKEGDRHRRELEEELENLRKELKGIKKERDELKEKTKGSDEEFKSLAAAHARADRLQRDLEREIQSRKTATVMLRSAEQLQKIELRKQEEKLKTAQEALSKAQKKITERDAELKSKEATFKQLRGLVTWSRQAMDILKRELRLLSVDPDRILKKEGANVDLTGASYADGREAVARLFGGINRPLSSSSSPFPPSCHPGGTFATTFDADDFDDEEEAKESSETGRSVGSRASGRTEGTGGDGKGGVSWKRNWKKAEGGKEKEVEKGGDGNGKGKGRESSSLSLKRGPESEKGESVSSSSSSSSASSSSSEEPSKTAEKRRESQTAQTEGEEDLADSLFADEESDRSGASSERERERSDEGVPKGEKELEEKDTEDKKSKKKKKKKGEDREREKKEQAKRDSWKKEKEKLTRLLRKYESENNDLRMENARKNRKLESYMSRLDFQKKRQERSNRSSNTSSALHSGMHSGVCTPTARSFPHPHPQFSTKGALRTVAENMQAAGGGSISSSRGLVRGGRTVSFSDESPQASRAHSTMSHLHADSHSFHTQQSQIEKILSAGTCAGPGPGSGHVRSASNRKQGNQTGEA